MAGVEFRFEEFARLYAVDPPAFERRREALLQAVIADAPEHVRDGMREVLGVWEMRASGLTDPVERARAALRLAGESLSELLGKFPRGSDPFGLEAH